MRRWKEIGVPIRFPTLPVISVVINKRIWYLFKELMPLRCRNLFRFRIAVTYVVYRCFHGSVAFFRPLKNPTFCIKSRMNPQKLQTTYCSSYELTMTRRFCQYTLYSFMLGFGGRIPQCSNKKHYQCPGHKTVSAEMKIYICPNKVSAGNADNANHCINYI